MKALAIDPGSKRTGYAMLDEYARIVECGLLTPNKLSDSLWYRIDALSADLQALIQELDPDYMVLEVPTGRHRKVRSAPKLVLFGCCVGALYQAGRSTGIKVVTVAANLWTGGRAKSRRLQALARISAVYEQIVQDHKDSGGDIGDAICLGQWWLTHWFRRLRATALPDPERHTR